MPTHSTIRQAIVKRLITAITVLIGISLVPLLAMSQTKDTEIDDIVREVLANSQWVKDAKLCPIQVMAQKAVTSHLNENECKPGKLTACLGNCSSGEPGACYWLGQALLQRKAKFDADEVLFQRACKLGVMSGCTNRAAGMLNSAANDERTRSCAARTFTAVCALDDPWACTMQALHLSRGIGVKKDTDKALKSLEKSCKYGPDDPACIYAAHIRNDIQAISNISK